MTSTVVPNGEGHAFPGGLKEIIISCDHEGCEAKHTDAQIRDRGGLKQMGWATSFDYAERALKHFCPEHNQTITREGKEL